MLPDEAEGTMLLTAGLHLGPYEIVALLGAGGMGEVYKARDVRLDRIVAVKVLSAQLAGDPQFRERFEREARSISSLNHPHICALYDIGEAPVQAPEGVAARDPAAAPASQDAVRFLVMEYLDGETLADRLTKGALPLARRSAMRSRSPTFSTRRTAPASSTGI